MFHASACSRISDGTSVEYVAMFSVGLRKSFPSAVNQWREREQRQEEYFPGNPKGNWKNQNDRAKVQSRNSLEDLSDRGRGN